MKETYQIVDNVLLVTQTSTTVIKVTRDEIESILKSISEKEADLANERVKYEKYLSEIK